MEYSQIWKAVLSELELSVSPAVYKTFFAQTEILTFEGSVATIGCNNPVTGRMMETRYYSLIKSLLDKHSKENTSLLFKVTPPKKSAEADDSGPLFAPPAPPPPQKNVGMVNRHHLRMEHVFDTFAVSTSNQMAYAAATAVAAAPGVTYNPLFLYGGVGVGKTHLMQAIGNDVLKREPDARIIYCMGEEFTNEIIDAIQTKTTRRFKDKYRNAKILLIDDIQFIAGKNAVQEEFFHTFNTIQREGGQIVMTSDRPPYEIERLEERLQSRFEQGLLIDVQSPDFELRSAILRIKSEQRGVELPMEVAQILAANTESIRRMEGLLTRILSEASIRKVPITVELAYQIVGQKGHESTIEAPKKTVVTPKQITESVMKNLGVTMGELKSDVRTRSIARPRQILMYLLRVELGLPLDEVGALVGGRDHTTVMHAVSTVTHLLSTNDLIRTQVSGIKKELFG